MRFKLVLVAAFLIFISLGLVSSIDSGGGSGGSGRGGSGGTQNPLGIENLDVEVDSDEHKDLQDGQIVSLKIHTESFVEFFFDIKNNFGFETNISINEIVVHVSIEEINNGEDLRAQSHEFDLEPQEIEELNLSFIIPESLEDGIYDVSIHVEGIDDNGREREIRWTIYLVAGEVNYINECRNLNSEGRYILISDVIAEDNDDCFEIGSDNVILNLNGHTIVSEEEGGEFAIGMEEVNNIKIKNGIISGFEDGIYIDESSNVILKNLIISNTEVGINLDQSIHNKIINTRVMYSELDFSLAADEIEHCNQKFRDFIGSDGNPVRFYNSESVIRDINSKYLILCDADNSNIRNVSLNSDKMNGGLYVYLTDNALFADIIVNNTEDGIIISESNNNILRRVTATNNEGNEAGIYLTSSSNNKIVKARVINNEERGIVIEEDSNYNIIRDSEIEENYYEGIEVEESSYNVIKNNQINNNGRGISVSYSSDNVMTENYIENNHITGIKIYRANNNRVAKSRITGNNWGISVYDSDNNIIENSEITKSENFGIEIDSSHVNLIKSNKIIGNEDGIFIGYSINNIIEDNFIENEEIGLLLTGSESSLNLIYNNLFNNEENVVIDSPGSNFWNINLREEINIIGGPFTGGNYWATPNDDGFSQTCSDKDEDGICDQAYELNKNNVDNYPLTY